MILIPHHSLNRSPVHRLVVRTTKLYKSMKLSAHQQDRIQVIYDEIEEQWPDISTERLLAMTADQAGREFGKHIDDSDVVDAIS